MEWEIRVVKAAVIVYVEKNRTSMMTHALEWGVCPPSQIIASSFKTLPQMGAFHQRALLNKKLRGLYRQRAVTRITIQIWRVDFPRNFLKESKLTAERVKTQIIKLRISVRMQRSKSTLKRTKITIAAPKSTQQRDRVRESKSSSSFPLQNSERMKIKSCNSITRVSTLVY